MFLNKEVQVRKQAEAQERRILVTGGAGFIGSELVCQLAARGHEVTVVDNLVNGRRENIANVLSEKVRLIEADVRDACRMRDLLKGMDVVFHLACLGVRHSIHSPQENHDVNATATLRLLCLARELGVGRFVYVSSSEVYGTARRVPQSEDHPTFPTTVYGASKLAADCYARAFWETYKYPTVVVRPFNTYGPRCHHQGDSGEVIPKFLLRCMAGKPMVIFGDGLQTRDFTYVSDTARGILLAGFSEKAVGETINIGHGHEMTILELASAIAGLVGRDNPQVFHDSPRPGDTLRLYADISKAEALLGYAPQVKLEEGLRLLYAWYRDSGKTPEELLADEVLHNWLAAGEKRG